MMLRASKPRPGILLAGLLLLAGCTGPEPPAGAPIELVGQLGGLPQAVAADGGYAYLGAGPRLIVVDVSDPAAPRSVAESGILPGVVRAIAARERHIYLGAGAHLVVAEVTPEGNLRELGRSATLPGPVDALALSDDLACALAGESLAVFDLADPAAPRLAASLALPERGLAVAVIRSHAYVAAGPGGLHVVDLSSPSAPREVAILPRTTEARTWEPTCLAVGGTHLCVTSGNLLYVLDVQDPAWPADVAVYEFEGGINVLAAVGRYVYLHSGSECCGGPPEEFQILDLGDPRHPVLAGKIDLHATPAGLAAAGSKAYLTTGGTLHVIDVARRTAPQPIGSLVPAAMLNGSDVALAGGYAYVPVGERLHVIDVADPASPREVGASEQLSVSAAPGDEANMLGGIGLMDGYACVRLWRGSRLAVAGDGLGVFNLRDPARPRLVGRLLEPRHIADLAVAGQHAYLAVDPGLVIVDLQNPAAPQRVASISAEGNPSALDVSGDHVCLARGTVTADEQEATLSVIDVAHPAQPRRVGEVTIPASVLDLTMAGGHACLVTMQHRGDWTTGTTTHALQLVDLTDPTRPRLAGSLPLPEGPGGAAGNLALAAAGSRVYLATGRDVLAVDVSDPDAPHVAGSYAVGSEVHALHAAGDYLYALSCEGGLHVLRLGE